jgi:hypothetical protein
MPRRRASIEAKRASSLGPAGVASCWRARPSARASAAAASCSLGAGSGAELGGALAWGLAPLYLAAHGASVRQIAVVAYPVVWGAGQLATGWLSTTPAESR